VAGTLAYTTSPAYENLRVVDISDPAHPTFAGYGPVPSEFYYGGLVIDGFRLYGACLAAVDILGLDNPLQPVRLGVFGTGPASAVAASGDNVYLADGRGGLSIIDVGVPAEPRELSCVPSLNRTLDVVERDHYAIFVDGTGGLRVVDVANPSSPVEVAREPGTYAALDLDGDCAVAMTAEGAELFDLTDPANPIGRAWLGGPLYARGIAARNGVVCMTGVGNEGFELWTFDMYGGCPHSVDGTRFLVGSPLGTMTGALGMPGDFAYIGMDEYSLGMGFVIVDVSDPQNPQTAGFFEMGLAPGFIACDGNTAYAGPAYPEGTLVLDVTNPAQPVEIGIIPGPGQPTGVVSQNGFLYISDQSSGLWIYRDEAAAGVVPAPPAPRFTLLGNYPNPSASGTTIRYDLPQAAEVELRVFDPSGRLVRGLKNGVREGPGPGQAVWDGCDEQGRRVATGAYYYRLTAGGRTERGRVAVVR
jgi:hypothetical protein